MTSFPARAHPSPPLSLTPFCAHVKVPISRPSAIPHSPPQILLRMNFAEFHEEESQPTQKNNAQFWDICAVSFRRHFGADQA